VGDRGSTLDGSGAREQPVVAPIEHPRHVGMLAARFLAAVGLSGCLCYLAWLLVPEHLSTTTDIVGYPIVADYALNRYFDCFYLVTLVFPLLAVVLYAVLPVGRSPRRVGAVRVPFRPVRLIEPSEPLDGVSEATHRATAVAAGRALGRVLVPAFAVTVCVSVAGSDHGGRLTGWGLVAGTAYCVAVGGSVRLLRRANPRAARTASLAAVNGAAGLVILPLLYLVSRSTSVLVTSGHVVHRYPWLPLWLVLPVFVGVALWYGRRLRRATTAEEVRDAEAASLTYVVGGGLLFVLIAALAGPLNTTFFGFDQAQSFTTARLTFGHGLFPWRDLYVIHGVFADILAGQLGMSVFSASRWGATAGLTIFLIPLLWVSLYVFTAYFARRNRLLAVGFVVVAALWLTSGRLAGAGLVLGRDIQAFSSGAFRFAFLPLVLVLFDQTIRHRGRGWCAALVAALFAQAIIVPETGLMAAAVLAVVVAFEWLGRRPGAPWAASLFRTWWCAAFGALLVALWVVFLAATGALGGFVDYYVIFGPGHALSGSVPGTWIGTQFGPTVELVLPVVLVLLTVWRVTLLLRMRRSWTSRDWIMVAAALFVVVFYQKVLARADQAHVAEVFSVALPLVLVWLVVGAEMLDDGIGRLMARTHRARLWGWLSAARHPGTLVAVVALVALAPTPLRTVRAVPSHFHATVDAEPAVPGLGYAEPGVMDTTMVHDLAAVLQRYAGTNGAVFDFSDEPGLLYFLLNRVPGTRYYNVSMADTGFAQRQLIGELERSRPRLVVFYGEGIGLPVWDGIDATVRHYDVSDYLLANYRPLADVDGQFVMIRSDLADSAPALPALQGPVQTAQLDLTNPECAWGFAPSFLAQPASLRSGGGVTITPRVAATSTLLIGGWSFDPSRHEPSVEVLAVRDGTVAATAVPNVVRGDVAEHFNSVTAISSGFGLALPLTPGTGPVALYALNADGTVSPLAPSAGVPANLVMPGDAEVVTTSDGRTHRVSSESQGVVDSALVGGQRLLALDLPASTDLSSYHFLELSAPRGLGLGEYRIDDGNDSSPGLISFRTLPRVGHHVFVEVGSCPQWHAFSSSGLSILQEGGPASPPVVRLIR